MRYFYLDWKEEVYLKEIEAVTVSGWTPHEISLALQGFNKYGDDFKAIAEVIGRINIYTQFIYR